ncbi:MAG: mechanosensitive ion channel [Parvularculaceae bacterium]|nr:mechanosensitive ion channel [Parvularculaceae bacterium]
MLTGFKPQLTQALADPAAAVAEAQGKLAGLLTPENIELLARTGASWAVNIVSALVVFMIGMWIAGRLRNVVVRMVEKAPNLDVTLAKFFGSLVYWLVVAFVVIAVLSMFGIETTGLAAVIGAAGLAIGLALQGTLSHVASGVMLLAFRPIKIGDYVEAGGEAGTVKAISLFTVELATPDNIKVIVPNGDVFSGSIRNYSTYDTRRVDFVMGISYEDDINKAMDAIKAEIAKEGRALSDPEPFLGVGNLGDSSVDITVRVWVKNGDYWGVKFDLTKAFKERFDQDGITIPYPTSTAYEYKMEKPAA